MTTLLKVKNNTIVLPTSIGKRLENKTVRLIDNGLVISIKIEQIKPKKGNAQSVLLALKSAVGVFPKNQDGLKFTKQIRVSWDDRLNKIYGRT